MFHHMSHFFSLLHLKLLLGECKNSKMTLMLLLLLLLPFAPLWRNCSRIARDWLTLPS
jgi:hypothetical protein